MPIPQPLPQPADPDRERLEALAGDLRGGDGDALGPWYELEFGRVHRLCSGFLGSRAEADDAAQDAMLHLSRKLHLWDGVRPYIPWRNALVANLCRDRLRAAERRRRHENEAARDQPEAVDDHDPGELLALDLQVRLERILGWLSPREREVFVLIDLEGQSALEAGEQLGIAASTVRAALTLARRKLRGWMQPLQPGAES